MRCNKGNTVNCFHKSSQHLIIYLQLNFQIDHQRLLIWGKLEEKKIKMQTIHTNNIHNTPKSLRTNRDLDGRSSVQDWLTTNQTLSTIHGNGSYSVFTLKDFKS